MSVRFTVVLLLINTREHKLESITGSVNLGTKHRPSANLRCLFSAATLGTVWNLCMKKEWRQNLYFGTQITRKNCFYFSLGSCLKFLCMFETSIREHINTVMQHIKFSFFFFFLALNNIEMAIFVEEFTGSKYGRRMME